MLPRYGASAALDVFTAAGIEDEDRLICTERLAGDFQARGESGRAVPLLREAVRLSRKLHGAGSTRAINTSLNLGNALVVVAGRDEAAGPAAHN